VQAGGGAAWSGDSGSMGDVSMSGVIEASIVSSSKAGVRETGWALSEECLMAGSQAS
jgi:hypothetical protein